MTSPPDDTTTDTSAVIAALQAERDAGLAREATLAEALATRTTELATRNSEYSERIEYQAATNDVLKAMSASPGDPQPVFDLIVERARDLCDAYGATVYEYDGTLIYFRAATGISDDATVREQVAAMYPMPPTRYSGAGRAILDRRINRIDDLEADTGLHPALRRQTAKSAVALPLLRGDLVVGALALGSRERGGFSDSQIELLKTFAEQAVIAITSAETHRALQERTAALAARNSEYGERIDQQAATIEVLKAMSASAGDEQPVLDLVARRARELCDAETVGIFSFDSDMISVRCVDALDPQSLEAYLRTFPRAPARDYSIGRAILDRRIIEIDDADADPNLAAVVHEHRNRSIITLPFVVDDRVAGGMSIAVRKPGGLTDPQKALARTLAEQVSLAIGAAETYRALQTRTSDLQETLEYQTATSDVLKVISRSTFDLQPVLSMVAETAARLCVADQAAIYLVQDDMVRLGTNFGFPPEYEARMNEILPLPVAPTGTNAQTVLHRAIIERSVIHIPDVASVPGYPDAPIRLGRQRTSLGVPLLRDGEPVGLILLARQRVEPFTGRQIELVSTFADQAVIAIENSRLITEQREALEQQTATAEVLQVINASPGNLTPVFEAILEKAHDLCDIAYGDLQLYDGEHLHSVAQRGLSVGFADRLRQGYRASDTPASCPLLAGDRFTHITDAASVDSMVFRSAVRLDGIRTVLFVPLRKDGSLLGIITSARREVRPFTEKEIALLENFAAQAVIAMENARLITETREALEQQTATAEVLQVINASPGELAPVFDALLDRALRLCGGAYGSLLSFDGEKFLSVAGRGDTRFADWAQQRGPFEPLSESPLHRSLKGEDIVEITDLPEYSERHQNPDIRRMVELGEYRSLLNVALRKENVFFGVIAIYRKEKRPFDNKEIALLRNFAAQAVIAMENARLLTEQQEALEQQTATAEVLQVINASPGNLAPVFDAMLEKAMRLCEAAFGYLLSYDGEQFQAVAHQGLPPRFAEYLPRMDQPGPTGAYARILGGAPLVHVTDAMGGDVYQTSPLRRAVVDLGGARTSLMVAIRKEDRLLGIFTIYRTEVRQFSDKQVALVENFAAQAAIAIENTRLLTEQQEALEQQTAVADVLRVINASLGNLGPVFDVILEKAVSLCEASLGVLHRYDGAAMQPLAARGPSKMTEAVLRTPLMVDPGTAVERLLHGESVIHIADIMDTETYRSRVPSRVKLVEMTGARTALWVALRKDASLIGTLVIYRTQVRPFSDREIALVENFAAQAVIAMANARLIDEQREALEQQTATAEVLQVINSSPGDLAPVFDAILEKAHRLCGGVFGRLLIREGDEFHVVAAHGEAQWIEAVRQLGRWRPPEGAPLARLVSGERIVHIADVRAEDGYRDTPSYKRLIDAAGTRTMLMVPLRKDGALLGAITASRPEIRPFTDKQIALLENFAAQAVIAMENARLLNEIRQRQEELRITFENMGDGVAMFDADLRLAAWNRNFQQIIDLPDALLRERPRYADYMRLLAERGEFGATGIEAELRQRIEDTDKELRLERVRPDGRVIEVRRNAVSGGGFVLIYSDITERKRSEEGIRAARDAAETALRELRTAQANLIQAEKMASLGQLTAGIAHEIKNPLNFVNNFAALSVDLLSELKETAAPGFAALTDKQRAEVEEVSVMLTSNLEKITEHGKRADGIVKAMLEHSRGSSGERRMVDLNALIDEALSLAYHGARAQDQSFNITLQRDFGEGIAPIEVNPQDITRVFLNLFANGFYAVTRRGHSGGDAAFVPALKVTTREAGEAVEIRVRDNGIGIPVDIRDKLFQPFFTTKPTGEGTGLGLSITYDIVTKAHGGSIAVDSNVGEYSEFTIRLPRGVLAS